jgi:hypothetical protein
VHVTALSTCSWLAHPVSCPILATSRPIQTRFRFASDCLCLKLATSIDSLAHSPKGTPSGTCSPSIGCKHTVSGSFHSPRRGSFHLSLTVLLRYRSSPVFSLGGWTPRFPTPLACGVVLRILSPKLDCMYGTLTLFRRPSQTVPFHLVWLLKVLQPRRTRPSVWAVPLSLATTRRILSFPRVT